MTTPRNYDSTVARIAGNLLSGVLTEADYQRIGRGDARDDAGGSAVRGAVRVARAILAETKRQMDAASSSDPETP